MTANASGDLIMRPQRTQDDAKGNQRNTRQDPTVFVGTEEGGTNGIARVKPYESEYDASNQDRGTTLEGGKTMLKSRLIKYCITSILPSCPDSQFTRYCNKSATINEPTKLGSNRSQ